MSRATADAASPETDDAPVKTRKVKHPGKSFSSRNPLPIGAIGLVLLVAMLIAAFNAASLPLIGGGTQYHAYFPTSAQLKANDEVRMAGVKIGAVDDVTIATNNQNCQPANAKPGATPPACVKVDFTVKNAFIGNESTAEIQIKTVLGSKLMMIDSVGNKALQAGANIPAAGNSTPLDVYPAFTKLTNAVNAIDTTKLAKSFQTLATTFRGTPASVRTLVSGLSRISNTISSRDQALRTLLASAKDVSGLLVARDGDIQVLLHDGALLLDELTTRREAIHSLLVNTQLLATQLRGLVSDNEKTIGPLLSQLHSIFTLLVKNQENLDRGLALLGPFYRVFNNVVGNGRWFDNYIQNLNVVTILKDVVGAH